MAAWSTGGPAAEQNALRDRLSRPALTGKWPSESMHSVVRVDGELQNCIVIPDGESQVVNIGGTHSVRGGALAKKLYTEDGPTSDRYTRPCSRSTVNMSRSPGRWPPTLSPNSPATRIENYSELAWGMKIYSYEYYENVFAGSKLALGAIGTPNYSPHHAPAEGDDVPGLSDCGIDAFAAAFEDDRPPRCLFIAGSDPYETKTVRFTTWQAPSGAPIIYVDPRRTFTAAYAEANGGLHLQLKPGTDTCLYNAIAREIIDQGWENSDFIEQYTASRGRTGQESGWRRQRFGMSFDQYGTTCSAPRLHPAGAEAAHRRSRRQDRTGSQMLSGGAAPSPRR